MKQNVNNFSRVLSTDVQIEGFVDNVLCINDTGNKRSAINKIAAAERNLKDYKYYPTLTHRDNRDFEWRDDAKRVKLRHQIAEELINYSLPENEEDICLGKGGAKPNTPVQNQYNIFFVIGNPASGKSGIAARIADHFGAYVLDSDIAKRKLPEYDNQIGGASLIHSESDYIINNEEYGLAAYCLRSGSNMVIPKIGAISEGIISLADSFRKICKEKYNQDASIYLISVDLDRQLATQRAYQRYLTKGRYVPLSLVFDGYGNQATLNYFKTKQLNKSVFNGYAQYSTDVPIGERPVLLENEGIIGLEEIDWGDNND